MIAPTTAAFAGFVAGLLLLTLGFATRGSNAGLLSMWAGIVAVLAAVAYYIIDIV